jgi:hypothetical protein
VVIRNPVMLPAPQDALHEWAGGYDAALLGLTPAERALRSDERGGRAPERRFRADHGSPLTRSGLKSLCAAEVDRSLLHNAATCITFAGACAQADGRVKAGRDTLASNQRLNQDDRPG